MSTIQPRFTRVIAAAAIASFLPAAVRADDLAAGFASPPPSARPWVYLFALDGNLSRDGITADLEAMVRTGIGGVLYMETDQGAPKGPARFGDPAWRALFSHMLAEAERLGLQVNMNNDAGWTGSGGPWITPELSMQTLVWAETNIAGGARFDGILPAPQAKHDYYRDIAVYAYPTPAVAVELPQLAVKTLASYANLPLRADYPDAPAGSAIRMSISSPTRPTARSRPDARSASTEKFRRSGTPKPAGRNAPPRIPSAADGPRCRCDSIPPVRSSSSSAMPPHLMRRPPVAATGRNSVPESTSPARGRWIFFPALEVRGAPFSNPWKTGRRMPTNAYVSTAGPRRTRSNSRPTRPSPKPPVSRSISAGSM